MTKRILASCTTMLLFCIQYLFAQSSSYNPSDIKIALQKLNTLGTVLYIAAHPDDENTRLLAYMAREKNVRTCYLSLNRGEGGQNLIGKEQGALLGLIRTNELLMARSIDGAEQYFTRVIDFGYSKTPEETFTFWNHDSVLADVVYTIRKLQPDVIITRFPTTGEGGHGHHTASAILAGEAFKAAADPTQFTNQLTTVKTWQAKTLYWNTFNFGNNNTQRDDQMKIDAGVFNPLLGKGYSEIAAMSRSQHKSQGFGVPVGRGVNLEYLKNIAGDTTCTTLFCNNDFTWNRIPGTAKIKVLCEKALNEFDFNNPQKILPTLIQAYDEISLLKDDYWRIQKLKEVQQLILSCAGIWYEAVAGNYYATPGDSLNLKLNLIGYTGALATLTNVNFNGLFDSTFTKSLDKNLFISIEKTLKLPSDIALNNHYWLKEKHETARYNVNDLSLVGTPTNAAALQINFKLKINDHDFNFTAPVRYKWTDPVEAEKYRALNIVPPATINFNESVCMIVNNQPKKIKISVRAFTDNLKGKIILSVPANTITEPSGFEVSFSKKDEVQTFEFTLKPTTSGKITSDNNPVIKAIFSANNKTYSYSLQELNYNHIPHQLIFSDAELKVSNVNLQIEGKNIGYIDGAGDDVAQSLQQIGYHITILKEENIKNDNLNIYDAIVAGVRAYNTNEWMFSYQTKLMDYVKNGGNYIVQYNTNNNLSKITTSLGPYPFKISRNRVTDEHAEMKFDTPQHPVLNKPNKITNDDFNNWIQERGIYFATDVDSNYSDVFSAHDAGEKSLSGSTLISHYGKGNFVYTGLVFFRELPAGVPGAYRLFANMLALPKDERK